MKHLKLVSFLLSCNVFLVLILEIFLVVNIDAKLSSGKQELYEDNEFAEFEEFDEDESDRFNAAAGGRVGPDTVKSDPENVDGFALPDVSSESASVKDDRKTSSPDDNEATGRKTVNTDDDKDGLVEDEDDYDEEEFDMKDEFETRKSSSKNAAGSDSGSAKTGKAELKITNVPFHLQSNWEAFYLEFIMMAGLIIYFLNFITGRNKNQTLANAWLNSNRDLLESNFALVGDDGKKELENPGLIKETENIYTLWCSGRTSVEGMLVELKFVKRQDMVSIVSSYFKPCSDQLHVKVYLNADAMDTYVFCLATKKTAVRLAKEMNDISTYCPDRKVADKFGLNNDLFVIMNEIGEVGSALLDPRVLSVIKKYEKCIDYIHISDQYSGTKYQEETQMVKLPNVRKMMLFGFNCNMSTSPEKMDELKPLMQLVFYLIDKVKRFRLSKEGKSKSDKNRQKVEEIFLKATHAQRQEAAQVKREEKRRAEKERILNEEDPEKQRRWEEKEYKRELKRKTPRMKQLKVKAM